MKTIVSIAFVIIILFAATSCLRTNSAQFSNKVNTAVNETASGTPTNASLPYNISTNQSDENLPADNSLESSNEPTENESNEAETPEPPKYTMQMFMDSGYYEEEVDLTNGSHKGWFGLYRKDDRYFLMPTVLKVKAVRHYLRDEKDSKEQTGREISSSVKLPNIFMLKNAPMLRAGEVQTVFYGNETDSENINRKYRREFKFNGKKYTLSIDDPNKEAGDFLTAESEMTVSVGTVKQVIYEQEYCSDCSWDLCWVGDLDKDGKLDFMLNLNSHYNSTCHTLFLSSQAKKGEIVRDVAEICQTGC